MGQKIENAGTCGYCGDEKKAVSYTGLYSQDEELLEIHCNNCRASWDPDGKPRALPSVGRLTQLGVLQDVLIKGLPFSTKPFGEWANNQENQATFPLQSSNQKI